MPRKRSINPTIWDDPDFTKLSPNARLLFIGLISMADDEGRQRADKWTLKKNFFFRDKWGPDWVEHVREEVVVTMKNVKLYSVNEEEYIQLLNWGKHQKQREERIVTSEFPPPDGLVRRVSDECQTDDRHLSAQEKLSKEKLSKEKRETATPTYLENLPDADLKEFSDKLNCSPAQIRGKAEDLLNYCRAKGRVYKDYRAFLRNALKKDFGERLPEKPKPVEQNISPEQIKKNREVLEKMRAEIGKSMPKLEAEI